MLCDVCGERDAVVKVTQVGEHGKTLVQMCERCAADRNIETTVSLSKNPLGEFLLDLQKETSPSTGRHGTLQLLQRHAARLSRDWATGLRALLYGVRAELARPAPPRARQLEAPRPRDMSRPRSQ